MKDMFNNEIKINDYIVYGKSNRWFPIKIGEVLSVDDNQLEVLGLGNQKTGIITDSSRIMILEGSQLLNAKEMDANML